MEILLLAPITNKREITPIFVFFYMYFYIINAWPMSLVSKVLYRRVQMFTVQMLLEYHQVFVFHPNLPPHPRFVRVPAGIRV